MENLIIELYEQMLDDLTVFVDLGTTPVRRLTSSINCVQEYLNKIKEYLAVHPFEDKLAEIRFFKFDKPKFYSCLIYLVEEFNIKRLEPVGILEFRRKYYLDELAIIERNRKQFMSLYLYYADSETDKDELFFLRANLAANPPGQEIQTIDREFSTNQDYLFSRFRAEDKLQDFIIRRIRLLESEQEDAINSLIKKRISYRWTGDKVKLIEIAYGIYFTRQMNDGKADINDIISWLEESLTVDLSQAYRMFLDIRRRKTISYTRYLDQMRESIQKHVEGTFTYRK